jgi:hypothetical protein
VTQGFSHFPKGEHLLSVGIGHYRFKGLGREIAPSVFEPVGEAIWDRKRNVHGRTLVLGIVIEPRNE